ncbi:phosphoribosyltransferase [Sulfurimonas gotlandica GD1]|uniref:Phosphoribosyltransferase n=1 Tax=Sulfurimonas gotlandica (strain DSM 19862 / JCM 16533 / GD1) TaxID=929558 RepID=B6BM64_SULGG|nr:phosphoribosyltransferase family protein [Sulfurimonas gotlandica]EDZ61899.1 phosphoribosyltransferase [Sulfurimonas gotlandica GD1]EHP29358.1 phosphoribosyltransferase [Sulfurimonas gotlandica GD1]
MKYYSYEDFRIDTKKLLLDVKEFKPEVIVAIARGGLTLAHAIAEGLDIREVQTIRTELYDKTQKRETISIFGDCNFRDTSRVLIVDDIADSGDTLKAVIPHLKSLHKDIEFKSATLFYKKSSVFEPNFWVNEADDWIDFFWERDFKVN